jgi:predicted dienelactone hydrolase
LRETGSTTDSDFSLSSRRSIRRIIACYFLATFGASTLVLPQFHGAERVEFHFEDMVIPIPIDELNIWNRDLNAENNDEELKTSSELGYWLNMLGFNSRGALSNFLEAPFIKDESMTRQLLRSWAGRKLLDEISDLIVIDDDKTGVKLFNTLESLLEDQEQVSLLDLLKSLPAEVIHFDLDGWLKVISSWKNELSLQQKFLKDLNAFSSNNSLLESKESVQNELKESLNEIVRVPVGHRSKELEVEIWRPLARSSSRENWIVFMPGLGGDQSHFRWLARSLSHQGWEVVLIDHPGSNSEAMSSFVEGRNPVPGGVEVFPYRLADLSAVLDLKEKKLLDVKGEKVVLMGHSLGSLISFLASGATPQNRLLDRCNKALDDLSITNLSRLLQCQIVDLPLEEQKEISSLAAIVGINSFGKLLWPDSLSAEINVPILLTGGTFDLITPAISEQLGLLLSTKSNKFSRALIIEGASHFSPIRVADQKVDVRQNDLYQISDALVGFHPLSVQSLLAREIARFLDNLERSKSLPVSTNVTRNGLKFHLLDRNSIIKILD